MKKFKKYILMIFALLSLAGCTKFLEPEEFSIINGKDVYSNLTQVTNALTSAYSNLPTGYNDIGESWLSGAADELEAVSPTQRIHDFNLGNWGPYNNPDDRFASNYIGIRKVADFLQGTDTLKWKSFELSDPIEFTRRTGLTKQYRAEARFLRAFFYAELTKRFGGVPLITTKVNIDPSGNTIASPPRNTFEECINFIVSECDAAALDLPLAIATADRASQDGRATKGAAMALKARVLLYAASDLFNQPGNTNPLIGYTSGDRQARWILAARAASDVMKLNVYALHASYGGLFVLGQGTSAEIIFGRRLGSSNTFDALHYSIGYDQGKTGNTPVGNLVDDYEMRDGSTFSWNNPVHAANPYYIFPVNTNTNPNTAPTPPPIPVRDPRFGASILVNNEFWNKRFVDISTNGLDGLPKTRATTTGYYLKKFVTDNLNFTNGDRVPRQWIFFRYAEILLNYAEAMNEAYQNPTFKNAEFTVSAQEAINQVRRRTGVLMPNNTSTTYADLKLKLEHERRIELAFEGHRWWDLRRWMKGGALGATITGVRVTKEANNIFTYQPFNLEQRVFDASKMYLYPIPQAEINKSGGTIAQNPNWN